MSHTPSSAAPPSLKSLSFPFSSHSYPELLSELASSQLRVLVKSSLSPPHPNPHPREHLRPRKKGLCPSGHCCNPYTCWAHGTQEVLAEYAGAGVTRVQVRSHWGHLIPPKGDGLSTLSPLCSLNMPGRSLCQMPGPLIRLGHGG